MTSATTRVHWLGSGEPPPRLMTHLKARGLVLDAGGEARLVPPARLSCLGVMASASGPVSLAGRRVAVLHPDPGAADALAQALRERGGAVTVLSLATSALDRVETFDPDAVLVEPSDFMGACWEIVHALWTHPRLRWSPVILTPADPSGIVSLGAPDSDLVCQTIQELSSGYDALVKRARSGAPFDAWLATLGPARTLRALVGSGGTLRVRFDTSEHAIEVDIAEHIIVGARELDAESEQPLLGPEALAHVLGVEQAKMDVKSVPAPAVTNVMSPLDDALHAARQFSTRPPMSSRTAPPVARRELGLPSQGGVVTVRPPRSTVDAGYRAPRVRSTGPSSARVYPFPAAIPPPPAPLRALGAHATRASASPPFHAVDHGGPLASAAAANIEVEWEASAVALFPEGALTDPPIPRSVTRGLDSGIVETIPQAAAAQWESADLNHLLAERPAREPVSPGNTQPVGAQSKTWLALARERLAPVREWLSSVPHDTNKTVLRTLLFSVCTVFVISLLARSDGGATAPKASARSAGSVLKIRIQKLPREVQVTPLEGEGEGNESEGLAKKPASRHASELVSEGHALRRDNKLSKAESLYREALKVYPGYPRALAGLSHLAMQRGDGATALRYARSLVRARPQQSTSHLLLGDAYRATGNLAAAKRAWIVAARRGDRTALNRLK